MLGDLGEFEPTLQPAARHKAMPRTLMITCTAPGQDGVGAIILDDLIESFADNQLTIAVVENRNSDSTNAGNVHRFGRAYRMSGGSRFGAWGTALAAPLVAQLQKRATMANVERLREIIAAGRFERIWVVLSSPWIIDLAAELLGSDVPMVALVWDDVEHLLSYFGAADSIRQRIRRRFDAVMSGAHRIAVIGESMRDEYRQRYSRDGVIVRHGLGPARSSEHRIDDGRIRIGFAGSVSARSAFDCLLNTVDTMGWRIGEREIELVVMGGRFDLWSRTPRRILCLGWRSVADTVAELSRCTFNYLPQPFESDWQNFAALSFPSKTTTYLAAGAPVLIHAPGYASLPRFCADHPIAITVGDLDGDALRRAIESLATDPSLRERLRRSGRDALDTVFSPDTFRRSFMEFLDA